VTANIEEVFPSSLMALSVSSLLASSVVSSAHQPIWSLFQETVKFSTDISCSADSKSSE